MHPQMTGYGAGYGYPGYAGYGAGYGGYGGYGPMVPYGQQYDIIGQNEAPGAAATDPNAPATDKTFTQKLKDFGAKETFGIKNQNIALAALAIGGVYYGYEEGWFGGKRGSASGDRHRRRHHGRHHRRMY